MYFNGKTSWHGNCSWSLVKFSIFRRSPMRETLIATAVGIAFGVMAADAPPDAFAVSSTVLTVAKLF
jgi:hypothetical protein